MSHFSNHNFCLLIRANQKVHIQSNITNSGEHLESPHRRAQKSQSAEQNNSEMHKQLQQFILATTSRVLLYYYNESLIIGTSISVILAIPRLPKKHSIYMYDNSIIRISIIGELFFDQVILIIEDLLYYIGIHTISLSMLTRTFTGAMTL